MLNIVPRSAWGARAPKSRTHLPDAEIYGSVLHWFGRPAAASSHAGCTGLLRSVQRAHMMGEYVDIAYNFAFCPHGYLYELRGWNVQSGANGTSTTNQHYYSIVYMAGIGDSVTPEATRAFEKWLAEQRRLVPSAKRLLAHGAITGSDCPGSGLRAYLANRTDAPPPAPDPVKEIKEIPVEAWVPKFIDWYLFDRKPATRPADAPVTIPKPVWEVVDLAAKFRAEKPDASSELRAKIAAAKAALS